MPLTDDRLAAAARRALDLAWSRTGATSPNPPVGCLLLDGEGVVLAEAAHERAGEPHAEAAALALARARGTADAVRAAVVTLEPCSHFGRTPPCAEALIDAPVRLVLVGAPDPHPRAPGRGLERLRAAGREVRTFAELTCADAAALAGSAARLIEPFATAVTRNRPFVVIKTALTAEGSMIPPAGAKTFTSDLSLMRAHLLRRRADALLTGAGTVLADAPEFTVRRLADHPGKRRLLAVLDRRERIPEAWFEAARRRGFEARRFAAIEAALAAAASAGALEMLVEAGPSVREAVLEQGRWDEEVVFQQSPRPGEADHVRIRRRDGAEPFPLFTPQLRELA